VIGALRHILYDIDVDVKPSRDEDGEISHSL
jgi:hypothetical protein